MYIVYGIPNCDTVKKTLNWLKAHKIDYQFHDYKKEGVTAARLKSWCKQKGWEVFLNKKGTTWRGIDAAIQATITNEKNAIKLMSEYHSVIKRPVIEKDETVVAVGFDEAAYQNIFKR